MSQAAQDQPKTKARREIPEAATSYWCGVRPLKSVTVRETYVTEDWKERTEEQELTLFPCQGFTLGDANFTLKTELLKRDPDNPRIRSARSEYPGCSADLNGDQVRKILGDIRFHVFRPRGSKGFKFVPVDLRGPVRPNGRDRLGAPQFRHIPVKPMRNDLAAAEHLFLVPLDEAFRAMRDELNRGGTEYPPSISDYWGV